MILLSKVKYGGLSVKEVEEIIMESTKIMVINDVLKDGIIKFMKSMINKYEMLGEEQIRDLIIKKMIQWI